MSSVIVA